MDAEELERLAQEIDEFDKQRLEVLVEMRKLTEGVPNVGVEAETIQERLGIDNDTSRRIWQRLTRDGLANRQHNSPLTYELSSAGMSLAERAIQKPNEPHPTHELPPANIMIVNEARDSQIQQGTTHSSQTMNREEVLPVVQDLVDDLERLCNELDDIQDRQILEAHIQTLQAQADSPEPNPEIVETTARDLKGRLGEIAASGAASAAATKLAEAGLNHLDKLFLLF